MKKIYSFIATAVLLLASTNANAQWTDPATGVTYKVVAGTKFGENEGAKDACDGNVNTKLGTTDLPNYIVIEASEPVSCIGYAITTGGDNEQWTGRNPQSWYVDGCNELDADDANYSDWEPIDEVVDDQVLQDKNRTEYFFECAESPKYKYFRFQVIKLEAATFCQYSEFHIIGKVDHHWDNGTYVEPTCVDYGYTHYVCLDGDGATRDEIDENAAPTGVHNFVDGKCSVCGLVPLKQLPVTEGWNADVVVEELPVVEHLVLGIDNDQTGFGTEDVVSVGGLPVDGKITTLANYQYTMDYTAVASLRIGNNDVYELNVDPVHADMIGILGTSAGGASETAVTVSYTDGSTVECTLNWLDWWGGADANVAFTGLNRFYNSNEDGRPAFRLFENVIELDAEKTVEAVSFQQLTDKTPIIMAIGYVGVEASGISNVTVADKAAKTYNLQGMEVKANKAGLYIQNGRKVIIK